MTENNNTNDCPSCMKPIHADVVRCKHCGAHASPSRTSGCSCQHPNPVEGTPFGRSAGVTQQMKAPPVATRMRRSPFVDESHADAESVPIPAVGARRFAQGSTAAAGARMYASAPRRSPFVDEWEPELDVGSKMSAFPAALPDALTIDSKLDRAFAAAVTSVKIPRFTSVPGIPSIDDLPITLVALNDDGTRPHVGQHMDRMYYSGSMAKIAAMYAAYQLRSAVNEFAATLGDVSEAEFFKALDRTFDPQILSAVRLSGVGMIREDGKMEDLRLPKYRRIFLATKSGGTFTVDFRVSAVDARRNFYGHMRAMIEQSDNVDAGITIRTLGYGLINGVLAKAGFFDQTTKKGIWLAGDYNQAPVLTIPSDNDGRVKQVTNCIQTARLFTLLHDDKLIKNTITRGVPSDGAKDEMLQLLRPVMSGHAPSILGRSLDAPEPFEVLQCKIGVGTLKDLPRRPRSSCTPNSASQTHRCVTSEVAIVRQSAAPHRKFVVCWQNVTDAVNRGWADYKRIVSLIATTMVNYRP